VAVDVLRHETVEPTNNAGERSLRHAVIWRKLSFGTQSANGSCFVETMLTVVESERPSRTPRLSRPGRGGRAPCPETQIKKWGELRENHLSGGGDFNEKRTHGSRRKSLCCKKCGKQDLNLHGITTTRPSK